MSIVAGKDWVFYKNDGGIWKPYICARSGNFNLNTEMLETTGPGDGNFRSFKPAAHDFTAQIDGIVSLNEPGNISAADLLLSQINKEKLLCRFLQTSADADTFLKQAYFYIQSYTDTGSFDGVATFSVSFRGTGLLSVTFTPPTPNTGEVFRYPAMGDSDAPTPGSVTWTIAGLGNKNILAFEKDGRGQNNIILSGTPVGNEVLYETSGADGVFTSAVPYEDATPPYVLYQNL